MPENVNCVINEGKIHGYGTDAWRMRLLHQHYFNVSASFVGSF